jgi:death-on-curing protein
MMGVEAYPSLDLKAAALLDFAVNNHALIDGNKHLGLIAVATFYEMNGFYFDPPLDDVYELVMGTADGSQRDVAKIAEILAEWRSPLAPDENPLA